MRSWNKIVRRAAPLAALTTLSAGQAQAEGTVFGGGAVGRDVLGYVGVSAPLPGARVGKGLAVRGIVSHSEYKYNANVGRIRGKDTRADLSLLYQFSDAANYFDVGGGVRYVDTRLTPGDPDSTREGETWEVVVSASGEHRFGRWRVSEFGSYGFDDEDYYLRGDVTRTVSGPVRVGVEAQADGASDYSRTRYGLVLAVSPSYAWELKVSAGVTDESDDTSGYGGVSFRASF